MDVRLTQQVRVPDKFLAVESCEHSVVKCFFVLGQLGEHRTQLQVVFAQIAQFKQLGADVEFLHLVLR